MHDQQINLPFEEAKPLIDEADVLLYRGQGWMSYFIRKSGLSPYTHVSVASWINGRANTSKGILECVEFREGSGGRAVNLGQEVIKYPGQIDVYRITPHCTEWEFKRTEGKFKLHKDKFNPKAITDTMRMMTGLPYGWKRIWWLAKHKMIGFRLFTDVESLRCDEVGDVVYPVCSTTISYSFNKYGSDLIKNMSDEWTEPADIARSARLSYLFTLDP